MNIGIACDHAGPEYKKLIKEKLIELGHDVTDYGTDTTDSVDYPDYVHPLAKDLVAGKLERGVLICGSANGVAMTANKYQKIRAAICWDNELALLARQHNDANIICIPARFVSKEKAVSMVEDFMKTDFEGGRHQRRVNKIPC